MIKNLFELAKIEDDTALFIRAKDMLKFWRWYSKVRSRIPRSGEGHNTLHVKS